MNKVFTLIVIFFCATATLKGQKKQEWNNKLYGFIRADAFYDTRKSLEAVDGLFLLYPLNIQYDSCGEDINSVSQLTFTSISSRVGLKTGGKKILNLKGELNARIEADFTARSNTNSLRLRHAYVKMNWEKSQVLFGRTWHPMFTPEVFPLTLSINIGTPFNPFNRSPQLRYTYTPNKKITILAAALYQNDYVNLGPDGEGGVSKRIDMMRNSKIPNLHLQAKVSYGNYTGGFFADYKKLQPQISTTGSTGVYRTHQTIESYAAGLFSKTNFSKLNIKAKAVWGQNMTDHLLLGGYAVKSIDTTTGEKKYTPSNHIFTWMNVEYGKKLMGGLLLGYSENMGFSHNPLKSQPIYARGSNIAYLYRISPYIKWKNDRLELWAETEITTAAYGKINYEEKGKVKEITEITNIRIQLSCVYLIL